MSKYYIIYRQNKSFFCDNVEEDKLEEAKNKKSYKNEKSFVVSNENGFVDCIGTELKYLPGKKYLDVYNNESGFVFGTQDVKIRAAYDDSISHAMLMKAF